MKKILAPFTLAAALCASAQDVSTAPAVTVRVKSLDAVREAVTAAPTLAGQPQFGLMATMGIASVLGQAGLSGIRPADPIYVWLWDAEGFLEAVADDDHILGYEPTVLFALPVADPSREMLDDAFDRVETDDADAPPVWTDGDELFVTVRDGWTLAASSTGLFGRASALLALPPSMPEATISLATSTGMGEICGRFAEILRAEEADDPFGGASVPAGLPDALGPALAAFARELNEAKIARACEIDAVRAGLRCDLTNGVVFAASVSAKPGTRSAEQIAAMKTPVDPAALASIPANAFLWAAAGDASETRPDEPDTGRFFEAARKHLLPLVPSEGSRTRLDAAFKAIAASAANQRAMSAFFGTDTAGRLHGRTRATLVSAEKARELDRAFADFVRAELAACSNAELSAAFDLPDDNLSLRIRTRALAEIAAGAVLAADGDVDERDVPYIKKAAGEAAVALLGENFGWTETYDGDAESAEIGAAGAEPPPFEPLAPDFSAEALFFPGQLRTVVAGIDLPGAAIAFGNAAKRAALAVKEVARENAEADGVEFKEDELADFFGTIDGLVLPETGSPFLVVYGKQGDEMTETVILPPNLFRNARTLADAFSAAIRSDVDDEIWGTFDDPEYFADDEEFDDEEFDAWDENTYPNPDPADLEDEDFDDDESDDEF